MWIWEVGEDNWIDHFKLPLLGQGDITVVFRGISLNYTVFQCRLGPQNPAAPKEAAGLTESFLEQFVMVKNKEDTSSHDTVRITQVNQSSEADCRQGSFIGYIFHY